MSAKENQENQLVDAAKENPEKFADLYDKYFAAIYRYVHRRVSDKDTVEDVVSQTFYDALSHLHSYQYRGYPFSSWLYKIAHNNVLKWYRVSTRVKKVDLDEIGDLKGDEDVKAEAVLKEEELDVREALAVMEFEDQEIIRLKYYEEVSNIEIAQIMGISANNVGVKLYRALKKLKHLIKT